MKQKTKRTQARVLQMLAWILSRFSMIVSRLSFFNRRISNNEHRPTTQSFFGARYALLVSRTTNNEQRTTNIIRKGAQTLFFVCALLLGSVQGWGQTIFYYDGSGNITDVSNWGSNTDGSGTRPTSFTGNNRVYHLRNTASVTLNATWTISGNSNTRLQVGDGVNEINFIVPLNLTVSVPSTTVSNKATITRTTSGLNSWGAMSFASGSKYVHNVNGGTLPTATWDAASTLQIDASVSNNEFTESFGNVVINGSSTFFISTTSGYDGSIQGDFTHNSSGAITLSNSNGNSTFTIAGNFSITGGGTFSVMNSAITNPSFARTHKLVVNGAFLMESGAGTFRLSNESNNNITANSVYAILEVNGNFVHTSGTLTETASDADLITRVSLLGTSSSTFTTTGQTGKVDFFINKTSGAGISLSADASISSSATMTVTLGVVDLGNYNLSFANFTGLSISSPGTTKMIAANGTGELRLPATANATGYLFPVGDNSVTVEYTPVTITLTGASFSSAYIGVSLGDTKHPNNSSSTHFLTRYWNVKQSGITGGTAAISATYINTISDVTGTLGSIRAAQLNGTFNQQSNPWVKGNVLSGSTLSYTGATLTAGEVAVFTGITSADPFVTITEGSQSVCQDASVTLTANATGDGLFTYLWSGGLGTSNTASPSTANDGAFNYTVTVKDANGISSAASTAVTITVNPNVTASVVISSSDANNTICEGETVTFTATPTNGGTTPEYQWQLNGNNISGATSSTYNTSALTNNDAVRVVMTSNANCVSGSPAVSSEIITTVNTLPTVYAVAGGGDLCSGGTGVAITLSNSNSGINYQLVRGGSVNVGSPVAGTDASLNFGLQTTGGIYTIVATNVTTGCTNTMTGSASVTVNSIPATPLIGTITQPTCAEPTGSVQLTNLPATGTWTVTIYPGGTQTTNGSGISATFTSLTDATTYTFTVTSEEGCTSVQSANAVVNARPPFPDAPVGTDASRCGAGSLNLFATPTGSNQTIDWYTTASGGTPFLEGNTQYATPTLSSTTTYYAASRFTTTGCVSATRTAVTATINQSPTISLSAAATTVTYGVSSSSVSYSATSNSPTTYSISWNAVPSNSFVAVNEAPLSGSPISLAIPTGTAAGTYTGTLSVQTGSGCASNGSSFTLTVNPAALTITGITAQNKTYDGTTATDLTGTPAYSGLQYGETFSVTGSPTAMFNTAAVGTSKPVTVTGYTAPTANYTITQPSFTADITAAPLTITADDVYKQTGTNLATPVTISTEFTAEGLVNSETIGSVRIDYTAGNGSSAPVGTYTNAVVASAAAGGTFTASNYAITYVPGNLFVGSYIVAAATGNWSNTATWQGGVLPSSSDIVLIASNRKVTVDIPTAVCGSLLMGGINAASFGDLGFTTTGNPKLTVSGSVTVGGFGNSGSESQNASWLTFENGSTLEAEDIILTRSSGSKKYAGRIDLRNGGTLIVGRILTGTSSAKEWLTSTTGTGTVILTQSGSLPNNTVTTFRHLTINPGVTVTSGIGFSVAGTMTVNGVFTPGATTHIVSGSTGTLTGSGEIDVTVLGASALTTQYSIANRNLSGLTVEYRGAGAQSMLGTTYGNLITAGSGTKTILGTTTVNGNLTIGSSTTIDAGANTLNVAGNFNNNGAFTPGTSTVTLNGESSQNVNGSTNFHNFVVTNTASNITLENGMILGVSGAFTPNGAAFASASNVTYNFNGTASQNIPAFTYYNLQVNGGGDKTLTGAANVSNLLTLNNGKVIIGNNDLTLGNASGLSGGSTTGYIVTNGTGSFKRAIAGQASYLFPLGSSDHYNPITYSWNTNPGITQLDGRYEASTASEGTGLPTTVFGCVVAAEILNNGYWSFTPTGTLSNDPSVSVGRLGHTNAGLRFSSHGIIRRDNSSSDWGVAGVWVDNGNTEVSPVNTGNVVLTQSGLTAFGEIAVAKGTGKSALGLWIGAVNGEAENSANWGCSTVPTDGVDVLIPKNTNYQPTVLNGDIECKTLTIQNGALLRIAGNKTISIADGGHFTNNGTFQTINSVGIVLFEGNGTIAGTSATTFHDLVLNGATTFTTVPTIDDNLQMNEGASVSASPNYSAIASVVYNNTTSMNTGLEWIGNNSIGVAAGAPANITIQNTGTVTLTGNRSVPGTLTLTNGTIAVGLNTLSLYDNVTVSEGNFTSGATGTVLYAKASNNQNVAVANYGNLTFNDFRKVLPVSGTIGIAGTFTPGSVTNHGTNNSTISFNGNDAQTVPVFSYHNLILAGSNTKTAAGALTIPGNLTITGTFDAGAYTHTIEGNWINNGSFTSAGTIQFDGETTISGSSENNFHNIQISGEVNAPAANMNVSGSFVHDAEGVFNAGSGTVTFNNTTAPQSILGNVSALTFNNVVLANTGQTLTLQGTPIARKTMNVAGNMTFNSGAFSAIFTDVNMTGGNWTNNGGVFTSGGSKVTFSSANGNQVINGTAASQTFERLTMNKPGRTLSLSGTTRLVVTDTFALVAGTYDAGTTDSLRIGKNWIITGGTFTAGVSTVAFDGEVAQVVPAQTYHKLSIIGAGTKSANGNVTINDELNISSGKELDMGTYQLVDGGTLNTTGSGTLRTKNTGETPLPNGKTWSFAVAFEGAAEQTLSNGTFNGGVTINNNSNGAKMNGNVTAASVTLSSGDLAIQSNTLTLNGSFNGSLNNALRGSATSNLTVGNGAAAGILYFRNGGTNNFIKDLRFMSTASATLGNRLNVTAGAAAGKVKVEANSSLASNGNLVLKSDTLGTAFVDEITNCTTCTPIIGEVEVERAMPNRRTWRLVTIPVTGNYTLRQQLTRQGPGAAIEYPAPFCNGSPAPAASGYGTMITAHSMSSCGNAAAVGADLITTGGSSSVRRYTHINGTASWASNNTTNAINYNAVPDQEGYLVFIRGDRSQLGSGSNATTFRFKGTLRQGNTASTNSINTPYGVVSNPYAAPISVEDVFANGTGNENKFARNVWVWDGDKTGSNGFGGYRSLSYDGIGGYTCADCGTNAEGQQYLTLNSGQAFMLQRKSNVSTAVALTVKEEDKVGDAGNIITMRRFGARTTQSTVPSFRVRLFRANGSNLETFVDATTARFNNLYSADPNEEYDLYKYNNNADENISLVRNNKYLAIESRPVPKANDTLYIPFWSATNRGYALSIQTENLATTGLTAELIDSFTTTRTPIPLNGTHFVYPFTVTSNAASKSLSRFRVVFTPGNSLPVTFTNVRAYPKASGVNVEWDVVNEENLSHYEIERSTDGNQFSKIAVKQAENKEAVSYVTFDKKPASGVNYYRIRSVDQDGTFRFSATMRVSLGRNEQGIDVYPTKVSDNNINIALTEQPAGAYNIQLVNSIGQVAFSKRIVHSGGTSTQSLNIGSENLPGGIYYLNIDLENGMKKTVKLFIQR